jgi:hypothetical protein
VSLQSLPAKCHVIVSMAIATTASCFRTEVQHPRIHLLRASKQYSDRSAKALEWEGEFKKLALCPLRGAKTPKMDKSGVTAPRWSEVTKRTALVQAIA